MATDFRFSTEDRPGELARVGEALGGAGINIEGLCGLGIDGRGVIHVCVRDAAGARKALADAGIEIEGEDDAILTDPVPGAADPGTLGQMARRLADAGVNVRVLYVATGDRGVIVTDDNARAVDLMKA